tara:strand:- start:190 stop:510 length:321 start_codon:yes stop_codon:yes gene_type:complete
MTKTKKLIEIEEPVLEINIKIDKGDKNATERLNWPSMNYIDLFDIFSTLLPEEEGKIKNAVTGKNLSYIPSDLALKRARRFKARLKAYIIEKHPDENFDWKDWDLY